MLSSNYGAPLSAHEPHESPANERLSWVDVDTAAIETNTRRMLHHVGPGCRVIGVAKADAYGHGAVRAAQAMRRGGAGGLAVATVGEGRRLRQAGISGMILVLGPVSAASVAEALALGLTLSVGDAAGLRTLAAAATATGHPARAHLKIDTGMRRLGLLPAEAHWLLSSAPEAQAISWDGVFTHFACADEPERTETLAQIELFEAALVGLARAGFRFPLIHAGNSAGALAFPQARYGGVRPGISLYGVTPAPEIELPTGCMPALSFRTSIVRLADVPANSPISYGGTYVTSGPRRIATIAAGYADGLRRAPAWREVLIGGVRAPIVGRICMDYAMVDVTGLACHTGDEVVLLGSQGQGCIGAAEVAEWLGTSVYEVLTSIGRCSQE